MTYKNTNFGQFMDFTGTATIFTNKPALELAGEPGLSPQMYDMPVIPKKREPQ